MARNPKIGHPPLIWIKWRDSAQAAPQWQWIADVVGPDSTLCLTVGFLIEDGEDQKRVAISVAGSGDEADQAAGIVAIPVCSIVAMGSLTFSSAAWGEALCPASAYLAPASTRKPRAS